MSDEPEDDRVPYDPRQVSLFDVGRVWEDEWQGMPEFVQEDLEPWRSLLVHFASLEDLRAFSALVGQKITPTTRAIWYPAAEIGRLDGKRYVAKK